MSNSVARDLGGGGWGQRRRRRGPQHKRPLVRLTGDELLSRHRRAAQSLPPSVEGVTSAVILEGPESQSREVGGGDKGEAARAGWRGLPITKPSVGFQAIGAPRAKQTTHSWVLDAVCAENRRDSPGSAPRGGCRTEKSVCRTMTVRMVTQQTQRKGRETSQQHQPGKPKGEIEERTLRRSQARSPRHRTAAATGGPATTPSGPYSCPRASGLRVGPTHTADATVNAFPAGWECLS